MFKNLGPITPYLRRYRKTFYIGGLCVLCHNAVWILFPMVIRDAVWDLNTEVTSQTLLKYSLYLFGVAVVKGI